PALEAHRVRRVEGADALQGPDVGPGDLAERRVPVASQRPVVGDPVAGLCGGGVGGEDDGRAHRGPSCALPGAGSVLHGSVLRVSTLLPPRTWRRTTGRERRYWARRPSSAVRRRPESPAAARARSISRTA